MASLFGSPWFTETPDSQRFPTLKGSTKSDIIVIGGGIVGVMAAYQLVRKGMSVVVLEKNHIGSGDTGFTTGFLTRVPETSLADTSSQYGKEFLKNVFTAGRTAQELIFETIKKYEIDCDFMECSTYYGTYEKSAEAFQADWEAAREADEWVTQEAKSPFVEGMKFAHEGKFHVRKFLFGLIAALKKEYGEKFRVFELSEAIDIDIGNSVIVKTQEGMVEANKIVTATGYPLSKFSELQGIVEPKITYVNAAEYEQDAPLSEDLFWDNLDPYFYFRRINHNTIIIGGCDRKVSATQKDDVPEKILETFTKEKLPGAHETNLHWSGNIFMSEDGLPYGFEHPHYAGKVYTIAGLGGNGLVFGTLMGMVVTNLITGKNDAMNELFALKRTGTIIKKPEKKISTTLGTGEKKFIKIARMEEFASTGMICKTVENQKIALFKVGEKIYAMNNSCSHAGGPLCEGELDGAIIKCPLHGARFDVTTGQVKGPPAVRPQKTFPVRVEGSDISIECSVYASAATQEATQTPPDAPSFKALAIFSFLSLVFYGLQFAYQYLIGAPQDAVTSLVRASGFAGATYFGFALLSSSLFKFNPAYSIYWRIRRYLGVGGCMFIVIHVLVATHFFFNWDPSMIYFSLNPFVNPVIFGSMAFPLLFIMAATSSDWAVTKLTPMVWKNVHRVVYFAYLASIFHFIQMNRPALETPPGYLLLGTTALALLGQLYWFIQTIRKRGLNRLGTYIGLFVIALYILCTYLLFTAAPQ